MKTRVTPEPETTTLINLSISSCTFLPDRDPDELVWKHLRADTVGRMTITEKADFKARSAHPCAKLQNDPEKIPTKNHRSNMPPDSAFTYGLINNTSIAEHCWWCLVFPFELVWSGLGRLLQRAGAAFVEARTTTLRTAIVKSKFTCA